MMMKNDHFAVNVVALGDRYHYYNWLLRMTEADTDIDGDENERSEPYCFSINAIFWYHTFVYQRMIHFSIPVGLSWYILGLCNKQNICGTPYLPVCVIQSCCCFLVVFVEDHYSYFMFCFIICNVLS